MKAGLAKYSSGYTVVELMVTVVIVAALAATIGTLVLKLMTLHESEREDAYIREKLADVCGAYADALSLGESFSMRYASPSNQEIVVKYRKETGGVSLETGVVTRAAYLVSSLNATNQTVDMSVLGIEKEQLVRRLSRTANGVATLAAVAGDLVSFRILPLGGTVQPETDSDFADFQAAGTSLGYLEVKARYQGKNERGEAEVKTLTAGRVVRLWNRQ